MLNVCVVSLSRPSSRDMDYTLWDYCVPEIKNMYKYIKKIIPIFSSVQMFQQRVRVNQSLFSNES